MRTEQVAITTPVGYGDLSVMDVAVGVEVSARWPRPAAFVERRATSGRARKPD